jgi:hypothetical protein
VPRHTVNGIIIAIMSAFRCDSMQIHAIRCRGILADAVAFRIMPRHIVRCPGIPNYAAAFLRVAHVRAIPRIRPTRGGFLTADIRKPVRLLHETIRPRTAPTIVRRTKRQLQHPLHSLTLFIAMRIGQFATFVDVQRQRATARDVLLQ